MDTEEIKMMKVSDLVFDLKNPRLVEFDLTDNSTEDEVLLILWEAMDVREVMLSIAASGFFRHEPLIVAEESWEERRYRGKPSPSRGQNPSETGACRTPQGGHPRHHGRSEGSARRASYCAWHSL